MIKDKIYELLQLNENMPIPENVFDEFSEAVLYGLKRQVFSEREDRKTLRLSQIGRCLRQQVYQVLGYEAESVPPRAKMTFLFGDIVEAVVVALAKAAGVNLIEQQKEVVVEGIKGHIDGLVKDGDNVYLFECKSMSDNGFKNLERKGLENDFGYLTQVNLYMYALNLDKAFLVAVNKNTGHIAEIEVKRNDKLIEKAINDIKHMKEMIKNKTLPERTYQPIDEIRYRKKTGRKILPVQCAYCGFQKYCYPEVIVEYRNNRPIFVIPQEEGEENDNN